MGRPNYGALGATFSCCRILQVICMIAIIGMTASFVSEIVSSNMVTPSEIVGLLSVACLAALYCAITFILYLDNVLPFLIIAIADTVVLIAMIISAVVVGKPLSYLNCQVINDASSAYDMTTALGYTLNQSGNLLYTNWVHTARSTCLETKAMWGLNISLCVLFAFSAICSLCLWRRKPVIMKAAEV